MTDMTTPAPQRAGTIELMSADEALALIGNDPETLVLAIRLLERMRETRLSRRSGANLSDTY